MMVTYLRHRVSSLAHRIHTQTRVHTQSPVDETNNIAVNVRAYASANAFNKAVRRCGFSLLN